MCVCMLCVCMLCVCVCMCMCGEVSDVFVTDRLTVKGSTVQERLLFLRVPINVHLKETTNRSGIVPRNLRKDRKMQLRLANK